MKKTYNLFVALACILLFVACESDRESNPVLQIPESFVLNTPAYVSGIYDLKNTESIEFTCTQPDYGFTAATIYSVLVSVQEDFSEVDTLSTTYTGAKMDVDASEVAVALTSLLGVEEESAYPTEPHPVYIRLMATLTNGQGNVLSNIITLPKVKGYYLSASAGKTAVLYITGDVISGVPAWANSVDAIGAGLQVLFADNSNTNKYSYTASFVSIADGGAKFPTKAGDWNTAYAYSGGLLSANNVGDNFPAPTADGYYTLTVDLGSMKAEYIAYDASVSATYTSIGVLGDATAGGWDSDIDLTEVTPHVWVATAVQLSAGGTIKFRANDAWDISWGATTKTDQDLPFGISTTNDGANIEIETTGTYYLALNDLTGHYIVIETSSLP